MLLLKPQGNPQRKDMWRIYRTVYMRNHSVLAEGRCLSLLPGLCPYPSLK